MNAIIIDDVDLSRKSIQRLLEKYCPEVNVIGSADGVASGVNLIRQSMPDLIFLDIEMKDGTGFDVLYHFPKKPFEVVFITAYDKYALKALKSSALEYLLKPIDIEDLKTSVIKAMKIINTKEMIPQFSAKIAISIGDSIEFIDPKKLIRCKAEGKYTECFLENGKKIVSSKNLKEFEITLLKHNFIRVHDSHLINLNHVIKFLKVDGGFILLSNNEEIPVSQRKKKMFMTRLELL